jgi:hypothetical protein
MPLLPLCAFVACTWTTLSLLESAVYWHNPPFCHATEIIPFKGQF